MLIRLKQAFRARHDCVMDSTKTSLSLNNMESEVQHSPPNIGDFQPWAEPAGLPWVVTGPKNPWNYCALFSADFDALDVCASFAVFLPSLQ